MQLLLRAFLKKIKIVSRLFGNHISQDSHKNQYADPVCNLGSTATLMLIQFSAKVQLPFLLETHTEVSLSPARSMIWVVCLEIVTTLWFESIIKWCHHCTSLLQSLYSYNLILFSFPRRQYMHKVRIGKITFYFYISVKVSLVLVFISNIFCIFQSIFNGWRRNN